MKYPSRLPTKNFRLLERREPVVYSDNFLVAPVETDLIYDYCQKGFMIIDDFFTDQEIGELRKETQRLQCIEENKRDERYILEPNEEIVRSIFEVHNTNKLIASITKNKKILDIVKYILNDEVYIHQSRINFKPGFRGHDFYWHSDFETWHVEDGMPEMRAVSVSISLTENYTFNGPLLLIPGSQDFFVPCQGVTPPKHYKTSLKSQDYGVPSEDKIKNMADNFGIDCYVGKPGSIIIFDSNVMHGSNGNISPYPRSNLFIVYNSVSNRVKEPKANLAPRPEYICTRKMMNLSTV